MNKDYLEKEIYFYYVIAIPKTWKLHDGQQVRDIAKYTNHMNFNKTRILLSGFSRYFWTYSKQTQLSHIGNVTMVFSKKSRNIGVSNTKVLVTNILDASASNVLAFYKRRFFIEVFFKEIKSGLNLGTEQVTKNAVRVSNSISISITVYLFIMWHQNDKIEENKVCSMFNLRRVFQIEMLEDKFHSAYNKLNNLLKKAA